jgi:hypothetical protein
MVFTAGQIRARSEPRLQVVDGDVVAQAERCSRT